MRRFVTIADLMQIAAYAADNHDTATMNEVSRILFGIARHDVRDGWNPTSA